MSIDPNQPENTMHTKTTQWVPVLTSDAGLTLTVLNWHEAGVQHGAYYLDSLLIKPGYSFLSQLSDFAAYAASPGACIINASRMQANKEGKILLVSPYDGRKLIMDYSQLIAILNHLKPRLAILPPGIVQAYPQFWDEWDKTIMPYLAPQDIAIKEPSCDFGVAIFTNQYDAQAESLLSTYQNKSCYVYGDLNQESIKKLYEKQVDFIESDKPAAEAINGVVYKNLQCIDLKDTAYTECYEVIDPSCACLVCRNHFTLAYLHHLFVQTPLLCQRYLVQHNTWSIKEMMK